MKILKINSKNFVDRLITCGLNDILGLSIATNDTLSWRYRVELVVMDGIWHSTSLMVR